MRKTVEVIILDTESEYLKEFCRVYCNQSFDLLGIPVLISQEDFAHIFSEPDKTGKRRFCQRRAKKMMFIKAIIEKIVAIELGFEEDTGNFAVFSHDLDCVIYLKPWPSTKSLRLMTFFDFGKDFVKMFQKQKRKCVGLNPKDFKEAVVSRLTTSRDVDS